MPEYVQIALSFAAGLSVGLAYAVSTRRSSILAVENARAGAAAREQALLDKLASAREANDGLQSDNKALGEAIATQNRTIEAMKSDADLGARVRQTEKARGERRKAERAAAREAKPTPARRRTARKA